MFFVIAVLAGICARLVFLCLGDNYLPYGKGSDTGIHWYLAQEILKTGKIQSYHEGVYEAFFPYLISYTVLISVMMKFFGVRYTAVLFPNIMCDMVTTIIIYKLLKKWKNQRTALAAVVLWMLNPIGIVFCAEGLALSVTNMLIALSFYVVYYLWRSFQKKEYYKFFLLAAGTGVVFALGNAFRVLFSVFLLAVVILLTVYGSRYFKKKDVVYAATGIIILIGVMGASSFAVTKMQQQVNPYYTQKHNALGWSMFVGANYDTQGRWSVADWNEMPPRLYNDEMHPTEVNREFMNMAVERYRQMSPSELGVHILNKSKVLFEHNEIVIFRNIEEQFANVTGFEEWVGTANHLGLVTLTVFACLQVLFFIGIFRDKKNLDWFLFFLSLCFCGLLLSSLCVEVMSRYVSVFLVLLVIFGACALENLLCSHV
ncbi:MAG: glycosyltransferase family 39 protein [Eubacterium sp.]|nr:glycosyltransferase family 39 protein [Eubacterium sp.]